MSAMLLIFIYFCAIFFDDIAQKYIKMSNMADITKKHNTGIYKDEQHGHHQKT
jgi:hypothetical protein